MAASPCSKEDHSVAAARYEKRRELLSLQDGPPHAQKVRQSPQPAARQRRQLWRVGLDQGHPAKGREIVARVVTHTGMDFRELGADGCRPRASVANAVVRDHQGVGAANRLPQRHFERLGVLGLEHRFAIKPQQLLSGHLQRASQHAGLHRGADAGQRQKPGDVDPRSPAHAAQAPGP